VTGKDFYIVTDFRYQEQAAQEAGWVDLAIRNGKMSDTLAKTMIDAGVKRVGFEANFTTFGQVAALEKSIKEAKSAKAIELVPVEDVMVNLRRSRTIRRSA